MKMKTTIEDEISTENVFDSLILGNPLYSNLILRLFKNENIKLNLLHSQYKIKPQQFNSKAFHNDCDDKGSTLVIMHSGDEPDSFFGGMAAPSWKSEGQSIADPVFGERSWLFKIEAAEKKVNIHQWECSLRDYAIYCKESNGPSFGGSVYGLYGGNTEFHACLPLDNYCYQKIDLTERINGSIINGFQINYPYKIDRDIMSSKMTNFDIDSLEVFAIQK